MHRFRVVVSIPGLILGAFLVMACASEPPRLQLPEPSGPHAIGVVDFELVDESRTEGFGSEQARRIPVRAWFPASSVSGEPRPYAKPAEMEHQIRAFYNGVVALGDSVVEAFDVPTHAYEEATPIESGPLPTVIFSHGGFAYLQTNTALMEHLASHGYLVLSISHPYLSIATLHENGDVVAMHPDPFEGMMASATDQDYLDAFVSQDPGVRLEAHLRNNATAVLAPHFLVWQEDFLHVVDRLESGDLPESATAITPLVDSNRLGAFGMSFGASGSAAAHKDARLKAAVNLDGGVFDSALYDVEPTTPILVMHSDFENLVPGQSGYPFSEFVYEPLGEIGTSPQIVRVVTTGSTHIGYTDACLLPRELATDNPALAASLGSIDGERMAAVMNDFVKRFFDLNLVGEGPGLDETFRAQYPEVVDVDVSAVRTWAATDPKPRFMSYTHVFVMNRLLAANDESKSAAAALDRSYVMAYELTNGPDGETVWWHLRFDPQSGMSFSLAAPESADVTFKADYTATIDAMKALRDGEGGAPEFDVSGDEGVLEATAEAFAAGQRAATVPTLFPGDEGY